MKPLSDTLMVLAVTLSNLPGHRHIVIAVGMPTLGYAFCGILVSIVSWVMLEVYDEQKFTI